MLVLTHFTPLFICLTDAVPELALPKQSTAEAFPKTRHAPWWLPRFPRIVVRAIPILAVPTTMTTVIRPPSSVTVPLVWMKSSIAMPMACLVAFVLISFNRRMAVVSPRRKHVLSWPPSILAHAGRAVRVDRPKKRKYHHNCHSPSLHYHYGTILLPYPILFQIMAFACNAVIQIPRTVMVSSYVEIIY